ncbi:cysteine--tRNA ligase [Hyphococcus flavus]|uniref:Cysteine--tRNA ligase n=1 Tax=Hyphococcus flavus TaxID=1866326 RepID=A0AAE9ZHW5_9PROT|nr:cysteine--tRNA ligase [Hyphococcus flavus]WDI33167.1 cysteine--tRNA ligase [Hyphococcus flavus]
MPLTIYDTMAREKRVFEPADPKRVTMYVCGPTVYNYAHIGNARAAVAFDLLYRVLRYHYGDGHVVYARNITDIDDKIIKASQETGEPISAITKKFADIYREDMSALGVLAPTIEPEATGHVAEMVAMIEMLIHKGAAYEAEGHVLFAVDQYEKYGALSGVDRDEMIAGARVEVAPYKKSPADFVLWKPSNETEPGWDSPWGRGRPGWHTECSVMIEAKLGRTIDIHGGGQDLRFPHHENEIAQAACVHEGAPLARYWMHNGFLRMGSDKMSKSLGNVVLAHDLLKGWHGEILRWALLSAHYRQPLEWTEELLKQSKKQLDRFYRLLEEIEFTNETGAPPESIVLALGDDLNTPEAYAGLHELRDIASQMEDEARDNAITRLRNAGRLLGFFYEDPEVWAGRKIAGKASMTLEPFTSKGTGVTGPSPREIDALLIERADARKAKNFARADEIRDQLTEQGIVIEDGPDGATWRRS